MRIHWTTLSDGSGYAEGCQKHHHYAHDVFGHRQRHVRNIKINGYVPVPESTLDEITGNVFSVRRGYASYLENRKHGYSCKSWLHRVTGTFFQRECIRAPDLKDGLLPYVTAVVESQVAQGAFQVSYVLEY